LGRIAPQLCDKFIEHAFTRRRTLHASPQAAILE
jgi:hypothetical protein